MSYTPPSSQPDTTICFRGVEITLPRDLPFSHSPEGTLTLDFSAGYTGKLHLRAGKQHSFQAASSRRLFIQARETARIPITIDCWLGRTITAADRCFTAAPLAALPGAPDAQAGKSHTQQGPADGDRWREKHTSQACSLSEAWMFAHEGRVARASAQVMSV